MFDPAKKSILPFLVRKENLVFFNKFYAMVEIISMMIGLAFGAFLLSKIGIGNALLFDASTYIFSMCLLFFLVYHDENEVLQKERKEYLGEAVRRHIRELREGWNYLARNNNAKFVILNLIFFNFLAVAVFSASLIDFSIRSFDFGRNYLVALGFNFEDLLVGSHTTFIFLFVAIGALFVPLLKMIFNRVKESTLSACLFVIGAIFISPLMVFSLIVPLSVFYPIFVLSMIPIGMIVGLQYIRVTYLIQMNTDKRFMGRVVSLSEVVWSFTTFFGMLSGSYINEVFTYKIGFLVGGFVYLMGALSFWFSRSKIDW